MKGAYVSVFFKIKGVEHSFNVDIPYESATIWNREEKNWNKLNLFIEGKVAQFKEDHNLTEPTDRESLNFAPHFY